MTEIKVIKNEEDYSEALKMLEGLVSLDPDPESDEGEKLNLLATLIESYESRAFPVTVSDPIEAIKFRMDQRDLKPADLIPYLGSKSRVSEILSGKRPLSLEMMRVLEVGLGIPAKVLLKQSSPGEDSFFENWNKSLLKDMAQRGYFGSKKLTNENAGTLVKSFFMTAGVPVQLQGLLRQSSYRSAPTTDRHALTAWATKIMQKAKAVKSVPEY